MKGTEHFKAVIKEYLDNLAKVDELFAKKYQETKRTLDDITTFVLNQVKNSGCCGFEDSEIFGMVLHCIDEPDLDIGKPIQCQIVVNRQVQLSDSEKAEQKALALKRFQDEEYRKLEQRNKPKVKPQVEKQPQASLFDEF